MNEIPKANRRSKEDERLKNAMSPGKPRGHVTEVADEIFGISSRPLPTEQIVEIPLDRIQPSPFQVRSMADSEYIDRLAESIRENGMVAPVIVRSLLPGNKTTEGAAEQLLPGNNYELVAGHHRLEAAKKLKLPSVRAVVRELSDEAAAMALTVDNTVRKDLSDYDRYKHIVMLEKLGLGPTQAALANALGVAQPTISNLQAFRELPAEAAAILELNSAPVGSKFMAQIKGLCKSHPDVVTESIRRLVTREALTSKEAYRWLVEKTSRPLRGGQTEEYKVGGLRLVLRPGRAELSGVGLNTDAVEKLIRAHWQDLVDK